MKYARVRHVLMSKNRKKNCAASLDRIANAKISQMVSRIGKKEQDMTGLTFLDRNKYIIEEMLGGDKINTGENEFMATYLHIGEIQEELLGIEIDTHDNKISYELDQGKD